MNIPDFQACMFPLLQYAADGLPHQLKDAVTSLSDHFQLTPEQRTQLLQSSGQTVIENRIGWARTFLKQAGLLEYPERGMLLVTDEGKRVLNSGVQKIDMKYLERYPSYTEFRKRTKSSEVIPTGPNPDQLEELLREFADVADKWFAERPFVVDFWKFMQGFFHHENLDKAEWADIQPLGDHIHSLQTNALARARAFGNPNYPIEQYRKSLKTLAHGQSSIEERMRWFLTDDSATSKYLGASSVSEIIGQLHADTHVLFNKRDEEAARYLVTKESKSSQNG